MRATESLTRSWERARGWMLPKPATNSEGEARWSAGEGALGAVRVRFAKWHRRGSGLRHLGGAQRTARDAGEEVAAARRNEVWAVGGRVGVSIYQSIHT